MKTEEINKLSFDIHLANVKAGWWDNPEECIYQKLQLISTEIAEATEGARKNLMDDHLPYRLMAEVEIADVLIRLLDLGGKLLLCYHPDNTAQGIYGHLHWDGERATLGKQHLTLNQCLMILTAAYSQDAKGQTNAAYSQFIDTIKLVADYNNYDLFNVMAEKIEYNSVRKDHTRLERDKNRGKKF